jgi:hypothetical protein
LEDFGEQFQILDRTRIKSQRVASHRILRESFS